MAWRAPRYCLLHAARDAGASAITSANAFETAEPKEHLIDDRAGSLARFAASAADHYIQIDRGAGLALEAIDRMWIPPGHNFEGVTLRLRSADDAAFTSGVTALAEDEADETSEQAIDRTATSSTQRYVRLDFPLDSGTWQLGELVLSRTRTTVRGPARGWQDELAANVESLALRSGAEAVLVQGVNRRRIALPYRDVTEAAALTLLNALAVLGPAYPVLVDPAFDSELAVWMRLIDGVSRLQDPQVPAATNQQQTQYDLELLENVS